MGKELILTIKATAKGIILWKVRGVGNEVEQNKTGAEEAPLKIAKPSVVILFPHKSFLGCFNNNKKFLGKFSNFVLFLCFVSISVY